MGKDKNISCHLCTKKYSDVGAAWMHVHQKHPESQLSPKTEDVYLSNHILGPAAAVAAGSSGNNLAQPLGTGPIVLQLSYSLSGGSPWRILNYDRLRVFHHRELPEAGPSGVDMERIQGLPGKIETMFNTVVNEVDSSVRRTQAIILSLSREGAQMIHTIVSALAAPVSVTTHLSVGKIKIDKDKEGLLERPHIVIGTLGRISPMLECKAINPTDVRILCVDSAQYFLSVGYEKEFSGFCGHLSKDIDAVFLSTSIRYKSSHDLSKLFTREPLHFLVKEDSALEPSDILRGLKPATVNSNLIENTAVRPDSENLVVSGIHDISLGRFYCQEYDCGRGFSSKAHLDSHARFYHPQKPTKIRERVEEAVMPSNDVPDSEEDSASHSPVYFSPVSSVSSLRSGELVRTHEEDEDVLFKLRSKLFRFAAESNEWQERGIGDVCLLQHKESKKIRLVMRRDKTFKVCANHPVTSDMKLQPNVGSDRSWVWKVAADYSENPPTSETFAIRFANPDLTTDFKKAFEDAQKVNVELSLSSKLALKEPEPAPTETKGEEKEGETKEETKEVTDHVETHAPVRDQDVKFNVPGNVQKTHESIPEQPATTQGDTLVTQAVVASTPLSLRCRMCDAPPTVGARPTVTTCGHLFCSECITQRVMSTSRCPVCDNALLLYCLFKLDLPILF